MHALYVLFIKIEEERRIRVGSLGLLRFIPGRYAYVGKALGISLEKRVSRHMRREKKLRWHIDYLTSVERPRYVYYTRELKEEYELVELLKSYGWREAFRGFGSSDDKRSASHLLYNKKLVVPKELRLLEL